MNDLRKAAEMALKRLDMYFVEHGNDDDFAALQALRQALAQSEQEPVAYVTIDSAIDGDWRKVPSIKWFDKPTEGPLYASPPNQEPVECMCGLCKLGKREWVGLTDEEIWDCYSRQGNLFYKAIEAKLKEKNT